MKFGFAGNIRQRLAIAFSALAIGPIIIAGTVIIFHNYNLHTQNAYEHQREVTLRVADHLNSYFIQVVKDLSWVNRFHNFPQQSKERQYQFLSKIGSDRLKFRQLIYLSSSGEVRAVVSNLQAESDALNKSWKIQDAFLMPVATGKNYYSSVFFDVYDGEPIMMVSVPFFNLLSGEVVGVLIAEINVVMIWDILNHLQLQGGEDVYLLDENNFVIAHANPSTVLSRTVFTPKFESEIVQYGLFGNQAVLAIHDIKVGNRVYKIIGERTLAEALRPAMESAGIIGFVLVIALFAALCLALLAVKQIIIPIQKMTSTAKQIKAGDMSKRVEFEGQDEIGELAYIFNSMTSGLEESLETLKQSEERYRILVETIPHGIRECDLNGIITFTNTAHDRILERNKDDMQGLYGVDLLTNISQSFTGENFYQLLTKGHGVASTYFITVETGKRRIRDLAVNWDYRRDHSGEVLGYIFIITDVTERFKAENNLKESESRFREFVEGTDNLVMQMNGDYKVTYFNGQAGKVMGCTTESSHDLSAFAMVHPEEREKSKLNFQRWISSRLGSVIFENKVVNLINKEEHDVLWTVSIHYDKDGRVMTINSIGSDITRRKAVERELELSNRSMEALYQISQMKNETEKVLFDFALETAIHITDSRIGYIFLLSDDEKRLILQSWSGEVRKECAIIDNPPSYDVVKTGLWGEAVRQRKPVITNNYHDPSPYKKGLPQGHVPISNHMNIPLMDNDRIVLVAGVGNKLGQYTESDIKQLSLVMTDLWRLMQRKRNEEETKKLQERLNHTQKIEALGTLAGGIAHDFNNILGAMIGYTELSLIETPKEGTVAANLHEVMRAGKRAKHLVDRILAFSRQSELQKQPVKLCLIVEEALKLLRSTVPATIEFKENIVNSDSVVMADPTQLHQIIMNLCTNAYHAMRETGGVLEVELSEYPLGTNVNDEVIGLPKGDYFVLVVRDSGHGMDKDVVGRIFEPYFTTKSSREGTGLGLSMVHGIVRSCGGNIQVSSVSGKGTEFIIYLPLIREDEKSVQHVERSESVLPGGDEHILVVDDEQVIVNMEKKMLEGLGYTVTTTIRSEEALQLFSADPLNYDLVITDMTMPKMNGAELSAQLINIRSDIPIILNTGFSEIINEKSARKMGVRKYVTKPLLKRDLAQAVRTVLDDTV
ncbi:MAG: PAS domain S-box protein [Desulfobulbaceae bacterium]|nr:PAS domain S-box protein [Desulfobulbaceae bacterium]